MADVKTCPKCNGTMTQGRILKWNEFASATTLTYVFAPDGEHGPDMSKATPSRPLSKGRKPLAVFCCENCGFTEFYGLAMA